MRTSGESPVESNQSLPSTSINSELPSHVPPKFHALTNTMATMQLDYQNQTQPLSVNATSSHSTNVSPLKRQNFQYGSPRVQLEQQQRKRLLEQRQLFGSDMEMAGTSNGTAIMQHE